MRYCITEANSPGERAEGDTVVTHRLFDDANGCQKFAQRLLRFGPGSSLERVSPRDDEVLFVLRGSAAVTVGGVARPVSRGFGVYVSWGTRWSVAAAGGGLDVLSVLVHDPEPDVRAVLAHEPASASFVPGGFAVVDLFAGSKGQATASREFALGVTPLVGCASVTQFVGFVPPGRAPDHFHRYDEVIYILEGEGVLHADGSEAPLEPGSCVHLPAGLVHSLENTGASELQLLGVFRPAGSPAEAYYPDGTPATY